MSAETLYQNLTKRGVRLSANDGNLKIDAPAGLLGETDLLTVRQHKADLLALLDAQRFTLLSPAARAVIDAATVELARRLGANLCPDCGNRLDLQHRTPRVDWCAGCRRFWLESEWAEMKAYLSNRPSQQLLAA